MPGSPQRSFSLRLPYQNPVHAPPLPHTCYMPHPSPFPAKNEATYCKNMYLLIDDPKWNPSLDGSLISRYWYWYIC
jgi:hypothetical protein